MPLREGIDDAGEGDDGTPLEPDAQDAEAPAATTERSTPARRPKRNKGLLAQTAGNMQ